MIVLATLIFLTATGQTTFNWWFLLLGAIFDIIISANLGGGKNE